MDNKIVNISIPDDVRTIISRLRSEGYEAYIVGGCVRDALLGKEPLDWDITTSALPEEVKGLFNNTVDTGIRHGTVMVLMKGTGYEVTTYRIDGKYLDGRHPEDVTFTRSLEEDLKRRDFTINAFAYGDEGLIDLFEGLKDLDDHIIRCVGDPKKRFGEDALRMMRAVRFSAQLGFSIEKSTENTAGELSSRLSDISAERIRTEWEKTLLSDDPLVVFKYKDLNMSQYIIKSGSEECFGGKSKALISAVHSKKSQYGGLGEDAYKRLMLAAFFSPVSPETADMAFKELKYDNKTRETVVKILKYKDMPVLNERYEIKKCLNLMGYSIFNLVLAYKEAETDALMDHNGSFRDGSDDQLKHVKTMLQDIIQSGEPWALSQLAITGNDLIEAGIGPGRKVGDFLGLILRKVMLSPKLNCRETLLDKVFLSEVENERTRDL